jgi:hypothetical protein
MKAHVGLRFEYQYQWEHTTFVSQTFGPTGPIGPTTSDVTLDEHLLRVGICDPMTLLDGGGAGLRS